MCFRCNDRYTRDHICKKKQLYVLEGEDGEEEQQLEGETEEEMEESQSHDEELQISLNALTGSISYRTMRVKGNVKKKLINILIDSGSTHNFLSPEVIKRVNISTEVTDSLPVSVADGTKMMSTAMCRNFQWEMQGTIFQADMRILQLKGCDMVLGIQWLATLGPVKWDFKNLCMEFVLNNKRHVLRGGRRDEVLLVGPEKMQKMLQKQPQGAVAQICMLQAMTKDEEKDRPQELGKLLTEFADIFQEPKGLPPARTHDHCIPLKPGAEPTNMRPYRYPYFQKTEIEKQVKVMLQSGIIRPSVSPYSSPVLLVKKKDGTWRMCVDYRALNNATVKDKFPIPVIDELLDELCGAQCFSKLDLRSGYHQIRVHSPDIDKTAFRTHDGHYEFLVMPFGLTNAPSTFQSLMNEVFRPCLRRFILVFFDDILIYSKTWVDHLQHLRMTLQLLRQHQLFAKMTKCVFGKMEVEYLGHLVSVKGVSAEPSKLQAISSWPVPSTLRELRSFLGFTGYYRRFIQNYGKLCSPLHVLLKKDSFEWSPAATTAFHQLKEAMTTAPVLALPDYSKTFTLETDASGTGLGAVLMQDGHPIAYWSKGLSNRDQVLSTYEKELMAVVLSVLKWRYYLLGRHFLIKTDHQSLKYLLEQRVGTPFQQKWITKLLGFDYTITYKHGKDNLAADALSRKGGVTNTEDPVAELHALSCVITSWLDEIKHSWTVDAQVHKLLSDLQQGHPHAGYKWDHGLLTYNDRLVVGDTPVRQRLIHDFHSSSVGGHSGVGKTTKRLHRTFYWKGLQKDVALFIAECDTCQRYKSENVKYPGLLQPLPIPNRVWTDVSMDFIEGLPSSQGKTTIFVVVDRLTKYGHFMALAHPYTAKEVVKVFFDQVFRLHGLPSTIVSDRDAVFTSHFWHELFTLQGCDLCLSTAYHPQSDGQTEIVNKCLENYLRCMAGDCPKHWAKWLPLAEWWYNTTYHSATKTTPYYAVYGQEPPDHTFCLSRPSSVAEVDCWMRERETIIRKLREHLSQAQQRMVHYANKGRSEREFGVGDWVFLRLQPYKQTTVALHRNMKLAPRFFGPYQVQERIGSVAYKLKLPDAAKIHPTFHVSLLKKKLGAHAIAQPTLPPVGPEGTLQLEPVAVLDRKMVKRGNRAVVQWLVQWANSFPEDATWVDHSEIQAKYPNFQP